MKKKIKTVGLFVMLVFVLQSCGDIANKMADKMCECGEELSKVEQTDPKYYKVVKEFRECVDPNEEMKNEIEQLEKKEQHEIRKNTIGILKESCPEIAKAIR